MFSEDDPPMPPPSTTPLLARPSLDRLGVAELRQYIEGLRSEIARAEAEITRKEAVRNAADSVFRFG